jgi:quercetin dioxygenase-like cupin family protein
VRTLLLAAAVALIASPVAAAPTDHAASLTAFVKETRGPWLKLGAAAAQELVAADAFVGAYDIDYHLNPVVVPTMAALAKHADDAAQVLRDMSYSLVVTLRDVACRANAELGSCRVSFQATITYRQKPNVRSFAFVGTLSARHRDGAWRYVGWHVSSDETHPPPVFPAGKPMSFAHLLWEEGRHAPTEPGYRQTFLWDDPTHSIGATLVELDPGQTKPWHHYPSPVHITVLTGEYYFRRPDGTLRRMQAGESMYFPANQTFLVGTVGGARLFLVIDGPWGFIDEPTPWRVPDPPR